MISPLTLYHNPDCSKSRAAHQLLTERLGEGGFRVVEYKTQGLRRVTLQTLLVKLDLAAKAIVRPKEAAEQGVDVDSASEAQLLTALEAHPGIMQRPIAEGAITAVIGRPPENVLTLLPSS